jgi:hypothetical protein
VTSSSGLYNVRGATFITPLVGEKSWLRTEDGCAASWGMPVLLAMGVAAVLYLGVGTLYARESHPSDLPAIHAGERVFTDTAHNTRLGLTGSQGQDMPHGQFWSEMTALVLDGFAFTAASLSGGGRKGGGSKSLGEVLAISPEQQVCTPVLQSPL